MPTVVNDRDERGEEQHALDEPLAQDAASGAAPDACARGRRGRH